MQNTYVVEGSAIDVRALIMGRSRRKGGQTYVIGGVGRATRSEFPETAGWPERPPWALNQRGIFDPALVNEFAVHFHNIQQMRKRYPLATLFVLRGTISETQKFEWLHADFPEEVFRKFPYAEVPPRFYLPPHALFERIGEGWGTLPRTFLFDVGGGDILDFGGLVQELSLFSVIVMLAARPPGLPLLEQVFDAAQDGDEVVDRLVEYYPVIYYPNDEGDFILLTADDDIVDAFIANPWWGPRGILWRLRNLISRRRWTRPGREKP